MHTNYDNLTNNNLFELAQKEGIDLLPLRKWLIDNLNKNIDTKINTDYYILIENSRGERFVRPDGSFVDYSAKGDATIGDVRLAISQEMNKQFDDVKFSDIKGLQQVGNVFVSGVNVGGDKLDIKKVAGKDLSDTRRLSEFFPFNQLTFVLKESFFKRFI